GRADVPPALHGPLEPEALHALHGAVERDPRHHLRVRERPARAPDLPDALVVLSPRGFDELDQRAFDAPGVLVDLDSETARKVERVRDRAQHVELDLAGRGIADADGVTALVARQPRHLPLRHEPLAGNAVEDLRL